MPIPKARVKKAETKAEVKETPEILMVVAGKEETTKKQTEPGKTRPAPKLPTYEEGYDAGHAKGHKEGFANGINHIVRLAEEKMAQQFKFKSREDFLKSDKVPTWWTAALVTDFVAGRGSPPAKNNNNKKKRRLPAHEED